MSLCGPLSVWGHCVAERGGIVVVPVRGAISVDPPVDAFLPPFAPWCGADHLAAVIRACREDERCVAVVLAFDTPGGEWRCAMRVVEAIDALAAEKPVFAYAESALSLGYWFAARCHRVWCADALSMVGSIGSLVSLRDTSEHFAQHGIRHEYITDAEVKVYGAAGRAIGETERAEFRRWVDTASAQFRAHLFETRGIDPELVESLAGRVVFAEEAVSIGLADGIVPRAELFRAALAEAAGMYAEADGRRDAAPTESTAGSRSAG